MAEQHRRDYESDFRQRGRGWNDRDDWRSRDDERGRFYEGRSDDADRDRGWRDQSDDDRYGRGDEGNRGFGRGGSYGGYQEGQFRRYGGTQGQYGAGQWSGGQYGGRQYGGGSWYDRGRQEGDLGRFGGAPERGFEPRYGGGDYRTRGEWRSESDDEPFWSQTNRSASYGSQGYGSYGPAGQGSGSPSTSTRFSSGGRSWANRPESFGGSTGSSYGGGYGAPSYTGGTYGGGMGVRESYSGRGPKDYKRSDDRIREDVSDRLEQDPYVDASDITVEVKDGEVTLSGTVSSRDQKRAAEDCVESVAGVREVHNALRVHRQPERPATPGNVLGLNEEPAKATAGSETSSDASRRSAKGTTAGTSGNM